MTAAHALRFEIPDAATLRRLASGPLPAPLDAREPERAIFRDRFWDTPGWDLARRGARVRLRIHPDGTALFSVETGSGQPGEASPPARAELEVRDVDPAALFAGSSEPARLLRAMTDPAHLVPGLELERVRWTRPVHLGGGGRAELVCEAVTLRWAERSAELWHAELHFPESAPAPEGVVAAIGEEFGARATLADPLGRAEELMESSEAQTLEREIRAAREVALLVRRGDRIAIRTAADGVLRIPGGEGAGEEAVRRALRGSFGASQGRIRLLASMGAAGTRPALEVWLVEDPVPESADAPAGLVWARTAELLERVGAPELRDARTLAALHAAAREGLGSGDGAAPPRRFGGIPFAPRPAAPERSARRDEPTPGDEAETAAEPLPDGFLLNMELGTLAFNERVLALAEDPRVPLLERVRFLSIFGSNLDEFFMDRVGGFKHQVASGSSKPTLDGLRPEEQLEIIVIHARALLRQGYAALHDLLLPALAAEGVCVLRWEELDGEDRTYLESFYASQIDAVLTPLAADPSHPFPHIRNLRPALATVVRVPGSEGEHFAAIELPGDLPRFVPLPGGRRFVSLEEVIRASLPRLYPGMEVVEAYAFRVTRSAALSLDEDRISDLLRAVEEEVAKRPFRPAVRLEIERGMPAETRAMLLRELQFEARDRLSVLGEEDVYVTDGWVDLHALHEVASLPIPELRYPPPRRATPLDPSRPVFRAVDKHDRLLHFPWHSFEATVERFLAEAADDPDTVSIKITLYRTSRSSRIVKALRRARQRGKEVVALIELKASFDEQRNIEWARSLEAAGIHVVFGPPRLKVHAKVALVTRRESGSIRRYLYIGTGNLNAATAAAYTDLGLLSADPELGDELADVFNALTGYAGRDGYRKLLVAPFNMRGRFCALIAREAEHARAGRRSGIRAKLNGLTDREIIAALCAASQAGTPVELVVRGLCALRPEVEGISERVRVVSVLGRFLEHSRIFRFENDGAPEYLIGSADWRPRNLSRRVEVVAPITAPAHRAVLDGIIEADLANPDAWELRADGRYERRSDGDEAPVPGEG